MESIANGPHYELHSAELARWLEELAPDSWWYEDGDPLLAGRVFFPCRNNELASELRKINKPLLVQAPPYESEAKGQAIVAHQISSLIARLTDHLRSEDDLPPFAQDLWLYLRWRDRGATGRSSRTLKLPRSWKESRVKLQLRTQCRNDNAAIWD